MIKSIVVQKTEFICDKCKKSRVVESELEADCRQYGKISEDTPKGFNEIEELNLVLCDKCLADLKEWARGLED